MAKNFLNWATLLMPFGAVGAALTGAMAASKESKRLEAEKAKLLQKQERDIAEWYRKSKEGLSTQEESAMSLFREYLDKYMTNAGNVSSITGQSPEAALAARQKGLESYGRMKSQLMGQVASEEDRLNAQRLSYLMGITGTKYGEATNKQQQFMNLLYNIIGAGTNLASVFTGKLPGMGGAGGAGTASTNPGLYAGGYGAPALGVSNPFGGGQTYGRWYNGQWYPF